MPRQKAKAQEFADEEALLVDVVPAEDDVEDPIEDTEDDPFAPETSETAPPSSLAALAAKVNLLSERLRKQESSSAQAGSSLERVESLLNDFMRRTSPMLETLSAELARHAATLETLKAETDMAAEAHASRINDFEGRLSTVLREMRELVTNKIESWDIALSDRLAGIAQEQQDVLASFEERVEELVRRFAADAIPEEMRATVEDLRSRFIHAETALAATRSSVEFLRGEVGGLTMLVKKLTPGVTDPAAGA